MAATAEDERSPCDAADGCAGALTSTRPSAWRFVVPIALVILVLLVFMPALDAGLVDWDDDDLLIFNTRHRTLDADSLRWMFTTSYSGHFQPLTWLTYSLDWALWRRDVFGYHLTDLFGMHLTSVLFHAATAVAFYFLVRRLLAVGSRNGHAIRSAPVVLYAAVAAALFAVHPLRAEPVAWLATRGEVVSALFYVLAVVFYLRYAQAASAPRAFGAGSSGYWSYAAALALCVLSLLAKASAVTLPFVLLILDFYPLRRAWKSPAAPAGPTDAEAMSPVRGMDSRIWMEKLPFFALALTGAIRALMARDQGGALYGLAQHDLWARLSQASYGLTFYIGKTLWPTNLGPLYEIPSRDILMGSMLWISLMVVIVGAIAAVRCRHRFPAVSAALAAYVVLLFPVLGLVQSGPQLVADRYSYLACMGLAVLAGVGLLRLADSGWMARHARRHAVLALLSIILITPLGRATFVQADYWISAQKLWARGVKVSPQSPIAHTNYADALVRREFFANAAREYRSALELNPSDSVALHHFAHLLRRVGRAEGAIRLYRQTIRIDPGRRNAWLSLGQVLVDEGRAAEAVEVLRDGAQRHPAALDLVDYLAQLLATYPDDNVRDGEEAVRWALHVSRARGSDHPASLLTLATAFAEAGRFDDAVSTAEHALALARQNGDEAMSFELKHRLALFRAGKPYYFTE